MRQMQRAVRSIGIAISLALLGGCASIPMQQVSLISAPSANAALITFVRPRAFLGDGVSVDIWDGERFVGALGAGTLVQYEAQPGQHLFLANAENWSYVTANVLPGKQYLLKANIFPGVAYARVALAPVPKTDSRIDEWRSKLTPMTAPPADKQAFESKKQAAIRAAVTEFKAGRVTFGELHADDGL